MAYNVFRAYLIDAKDIMTPWFTNSQFVCYKSNKNYATMHKIH